MGEKSRMYESLFSRSGLSLERLKTLIDVADAGGIAKAVGDDPVRQSQYSRQLKELEQFAGVALTCRQGRTLGLTVAGMRLATLTREAFAGLDDFVATARKESASYRVAAGEALLHWVIVPSLGRLTEELPRVRFICVNQRTEAIVAGLSAFELDFGVVRANAVPEGLCSVSIGTREYRLFVPHALLGPAERKLRPESLLSRLPVAVLDGGGEYMDGLQSIAKNRDGCLNATLGCTTLPQICRAVQSGAFIGVLPVQARTELPESSHAEFSFAALKVLRRPLTLAWNPRLERIRDGAVRVQIALVEALRA